MKSCRAVENISWQRVATDHCLLTDFLQQKKKRRNICMAIWFFQGDTWQWHCEQRVTDCRQKSMSGNGSAWQSVVVTIVQFIDPWINTQHDQQWQHASTHGHCVSTSATHACIHCLVVSVLNQSALCELMRWMHHYSCKHVWIICWTRQTCDAGSLLAHCWQISSWHQMSVGYNA